MLDLVQDPDGTGGVPGLRRDVDAPYGPHLDAVDPAAVARAGHRADGSSALRVVLLAVLAIVVLAAAPGPRATPGHRRRRSRAWSPPSPSPRMPAPRPRPRPRRLGHEYDGRTLGGTGRVPEGFSSVIIEVTQPDGSVVEWCVLLADTPQNRARGLMEVDSLGDYDGMLFSFDGESFGSFYMLQTRIPLSIAFIAADGSFVSSTDMEPCPDDDDDPPCPRYAPKPPTSLPWRCRKAASTSWGSAPARRCARSIDRADRPR